MKILLVSNEYTRPGRIGNPIINRLHDALATIPGVSEVSFVPFTNSFRSFALIRKAAFKADIIHIQFGGLYAFLVWIAMIGVNVPKFLTFHGTDIHAKEIKTTKSLVVKIKIWLSQKASFFLILLMDKSGFVSDSLYSYVPEWIRHRCKDKIFLQPLGVDYKLFRPIDKVNACKKLGLDVKNYILFSDKSNTKLKRLDIATNISKELTPEYELLTMCGVRPEMVPLYVNACEFVILTSDEEGSPNIIREALSLNKRVFSVDVGDAKQQLQGLNNSSIISRDPKVAANQIKSKLAEPYMDNTRTSLQNKIDFLKIAESLVSIYKDYLKNRN